MKKISKYIGLFLYLSFLFWRMFFYAFGNYHRSKSIGLRYNLIPFKTILSLIINYSKYDFVVWVYNLIGNIVIFIPLGFFLSIIISRKNKIRTVMLASLTTILFAETMQLVLRVGVFDIDDVILNIFGCLIGYICVKPINNISLFISKFYNQLKREKEK